MPNGTSQRRGGPPLALQIALIAGAIAVAVVYTAVTASQPVPAQDRALAALYCLSGLAFIVTGLIAWRKRPGNRIGPLMVATGCFILLGRGVRQFESPVIYTISAFAWGPYGALFAWTILAFPTGRLRGNFERLIIGAWLFSNVVLKTIVRTFNEPHELGCEPCPPGLNLLHIEGTTHLYEPMLRANDTLVQALILAVIPILTLRLIRATPPARRVLFVPVVAGLCVAVASTVVVATTIVAGLPSGPTIPVGVMQAVDVSMKVEAITIVILPLGLLSGLLRTRVTRSNVGSLVVELSAIPPARELRGILARTLGDPSLVLGLRVGDRYLDVDAEPIELPPPDGRAATPVDYGGEPLAVLVHDPALLEDDGLLDAVAAAARMALQNARLQADIQSQLKEIQASRTRIVEAADEERRRLERDIHDGAQQRLVALSMALRMLHEEVGVKVDPSLADLIGRANDEARAAIDEVRDLARGVHPKILTDAGLDDALISLAESAAGPVRVESDLRRRFAPAVEAAAYFVCCEALANVAKHAAASSAVIRTAYADGRLEIRVEDEGPGGAGLDRGKGLTGLSDRVAALGGRLRVESHEGAGTRVSASIPAAAIESGEPSVP